MLSAPTLDLALVLLGAALPLSIAASNAALGLTTLGLLLALAEPASRAAAAARLRGAALSPLAAAAAVYAGASLVSGLCGLAPAKSLAIWPKDLHKIWVVLLLGAVASARRRDRFARGLAAGACAAAVAGVAQTLAAVAALLRAQTGFDKDIARSFLRAHGFIHPVSYGEALGLAFLGLLIAGERFLPRRERWIAVAVTGIALLCNQTRTVLVALIAGLALAAVVEDRWRRPFLASLVAGAAALGGWEFMQKGRSIADLVSRGLESQQAARLTLWRVGLQIFRDHPWTGVGPGQYRTAFSSYFAGSLDSEKNWGNAHNLVIHQAAERGLLGLAALGVVAAAIGSTAWRAFRSRRDAWTLWALTSALAFAVMNLTETAFQTEQIATLFLAIVVLAAPDPAEPE